MDKLKAKETNYYVEYTYLTSNNKLVDDYYCFESKNEAHKFITSLINSLDIKSMYLRTMEKFI